MAVSEQLGVAIVGVLVTVLGFSFQWFREARNRRWAKEDHDARAEDLKLEAEKRASELRVETEKRAEELKSMAESQASRSEEQRTEMRKKIEKISLDTALTRQAIENQDKKFDDITKAALQAAIGSVQSTHHSSPDYGQEPHGGHSHSRSG